MNAAPVHATAVDASGRDARGVMSTASVRWLLAGLATAVALRVVLGGGAIAQSPRAGLVFAAALAVLTWSIRPPAGFGVRAVVVGFAGAGVLCAPAGLAALGGAGGHRPAGSYAAWAAVVSVVAVAEEAFLRGALYDAVRAWRDERTAVVVGAVAFAALHVPLYGWHVVPLDLAVGGWLGVLRARSGGWAAPAVAHTVADLAAWWLQ